jgi:hypothetical protein
MKLKAGDWVEVRSREEILGTLDHKGCMEELPFMPQMFQYCGQRFTVYKRAHKTCDTVNGTGGRRLPDAVHLELRCDGEAYGGCQAACLVFWKNAWLKPLSKTAGKTEPSWKGDESLRESQRVEPHRCTENDVWKGTHAADQAAGEEKRYICQATQLPYFTTLLPWWNLRQYLEDITSGNVTVSRALRGMIYANYYNLSRAGIGLGRPLRWLYDKFQSLWGGIPYPRKWGTIPAGQPTPTCSLNLQPGDFVRVKSYREILATLDRAGKNRGLSFDAELVPYCGGSYRVRTRVCRFINEKTGKMVELKNDTIILENVWCQARYSDCRMFCPRSIYSWWREVWLERITESAGTSANPEADSPSSSRDQSCRECSKYDEAPRHD